MKDLKSFEIELKEKFDKLVYPEIDVEDKVMDKIFRFKKQSFSIRKFSLIAACLMVFIVFSMNISALFPTISIRHDSSMTQRNYEKLIDSSDNVLYGKILRQVNRREVSGKNFLSYVEYQIAVEKNYKGTASETIVLKQEPIYFESWSKMHNDQPWFKEKDKYFFFLKKTDDSEYEIVNKGNGFIPVKDDHEFKDIENILNNYVTK